MITDYNVRVFASYGSHLLSITDISSNMEGFMSMSILKFSHMKLKVDYMFNLHDFLGNTRIFCIAMKKTVYYVL